MKANAKAQFAVFMKIGGFHMQSGGFHEKRRFSYRIRVMHG